jgi:hypothetical protein
MKNLTSAAEIVEALGGIKKVAALTRATKSATLNWLYVFESFPSHTYKIMTDALTALDYTAPPHLWRMRGYEKRKRAA